MTDFPGPLVALPASYASRWHTGIKPSSDSTAQRWLRDLTDMLIGQTSPASRWDGFAAGLAKIGLDQVNYGVFCNFAASRKSAPIRFLSTMAPGWLDYYQDQRLDLHDMHAELARIEVFAPYRWGRSGIALLDSDDRKRTQALTTEAGLTASLHVPLPDPLDATRYAGGITLGCSNSELEFGKLLSKYHAPLVVVSHLFHSLTIAEWRREDLPGKQLSPRERECLTWIAEGLRIAATAERMQLSQATVEMHLRNARQKLAAATLPQAVARALVTQQVRLGLAGAARCGGRAYCS